MMRRQRFQATFECDPKTLNMQCTIRVQGERVTGDGRTYSDAMEDCFVKVREKTGTSFWLLLERGELKRVPHDH